MSDVVKRQYSILSQLRLLDEKAVRIQRDLDRIPQTIGTIRTDFEAAKAGFQKLDDQYRANEKRLRSNESDLKDREMKLQKANDKLSDVRSNEEFQAAQREIAAQKQLKSAIEDQILEMFTYIEKEGANYKEKQAAIQALEQKMNTELAELESDAEKFRKQKEEIDAQRAVVMRDLMPEYASAYNRGYAQNRGSAISVANAGKCTGCNMLIRAQIYNEILGFRAVHRCGHCGRVLILQSAEDERAEGALRSANAHS